jgi:tripartite ATP-independent transporter DctM subunit
MSNDQVKASFKSIEFQAVFARIEDAFAFIVRRIALLATCSLLLVALGTVVDVVMRDFFHTTLIGLNEISALLVAVAAATCLPAGLSAGAALQVDLITGRMSERARSWLEVLATALGCLFWAFMASRVWSTAGVMADANQTTLMTGLPVAPFFRVMAVALGFGSFAMLLQFVRHVGKVLTGIGSALALLVGLLLLAQITLVLTDVIGPGFYRLINPTMPVALAGLVFFVLWVLIILTAPIGAALGFAGLVGTAALMGVPTALSVMGTETTSFVTQDSLSVLPLFLLMGAFASVAGIGSDLYRLSNALVGHIRGGLAYASILACAGFGTLTGSSIATQMTIGRIALKEMQDRKYSTELASGAIAAGGTLGQLLPPSSALILYAVLTQQSVGQLFIGAIIPGLLATALYLLTLTVWLWLRPQDAPTGTRSSARELVDAAKGAWTVLVLLGLVLGGIYLGLFSELEAGAVGAVGAFLIAAARGKLNAASFWKTMGQSTHSLATIYSLLFGVTILTFFFGVSGVPQAFLSYVTGLGLPPMGVVVILVICYLVLGTFMDGFAIMLITIPIFVPAVHALGFSPIWWGIMTLVCMEAGQISPPFGLNIFIISSLDPTIKLPTVYRGCWPFFGSTLLKIVLLMLFPLLATWLPGTM